MKPPNHTIRILGVMTGTSCDGLDAACIEIDPEGWKPLWSAEAPYSQALRKRVLAAQKPGGKQDLVEWLKLDRDLGDWFASTLRKTVSAQARKPGMSPHLIANHGQTIGHFPSERVTLQMGDPTRIAQATGLSVVSNFRAGDLAAGGQGAPLVPLFHRLLAHHLGDPAQGLSIHNIGGISNLTYLGPKDEILAFDTGPGNLWIDAAAGLATKGRLKMDVDGKLARQGKVDEKAVWAVLRHAYFIKSAPKSTGRNEFTLELLLSKTRAKGADLVATATAVTVESMAQAYELFVLKRKRPLDSIFFCGGGAKNPSLMHGMQARLPEVQMMNLTDAGFDGQLIEAQAFAYLGFLSLLGQPVGGSWTGATGFGPPAQITPGENWEQVMSILHEIRSQS